MRCWIIFCIFIGQFQGFLAAQLPWDSAVVSKCETRARRKNFVSFFVPSWGEGWRKGRRKPTGIKDLLKIKNQPKPSTEQGAINSKTQSCRKANLVEILINLQNVFCINREIFQSQRAEKLILEWHLFESTFIRARMYPAQILLYLHLVTRDIPMLI